MKILHDIHTHNLFSACCGDRTASTRAFLEKEAALGMKIFGLSNHIWDERVEGASSFYKPQTIALAEEAKVSFASAPKGLRVLFGAETEFAYDKGILGMTREGAAHFDYLLIPHSHIHQRNFVVPELPEAAEVRREVEAKLRETFPLFNDWTIEHMMEVVYEKQLLLMAPELKTKKTAFFAKQMQDSLNALLEHEDVLAIAKTIPVSVAHPFAPCGMKLDEQNECLSLLDEQALFDSFSRAARAGIYMELHTGEIMYLCEDLSRNQGIRLMKIAKKAGCQFTFGTDSHSVAGLAHIRCGDAIAEALELTRNDIAEFVRDGVESIL